MHTMSLSWKAALGIAIAHLRSEPKGKAEVRLSNALDAWLEAFTTQIGGQILPKPSAWASDEKTIEKASPISVDLESSIHGHAKAIVDGFIEKGVPGHQTRFVQSALEALESATEKK